MTKKSHSDLFNEKEKWYLFSDTPSGQGHAVCGQITVSQDSLWFAGHFPGDPILPGVAQLQMIRDLIQTGLGQQIQVASIDRVRFKQVIRPGERLQLQAAPEAEGASRYTFKIIKDGEIATSGRITLVAG